MEEKPRAPQELIESKMRDFIQAGRYELAHLFSEEGLVLAEAFGSRVIERDRLAEVSVMFQEVRKLAETMGGISQLREVIMEGQNRRKIVFRFFPAFGQEVILVAVVPPRTAYRQATNQLVKLVESIEV
jgi:predicted regulator of Ras-like GTPase activity (Roadblock/LC7/MglB family)